MEKGFMLYSMPRLRLSLGVLAVATTVAPVAAKPVHPKENPPNTICSDAHRSVVVAPEGTEFLRYLQKRQIAIIPFTFFQDTKQILVQATFDRTVAVTLLVDTGASNLYLFHSVTKKYPNLTFKPDDGSKLNQGVCTFEDISIGHLTTFGEVVLLKPSLADKSVAEHFDGVLGVNVLEDHAVLINYDTKEIAMIIDGNLTKQEVESFGFRGEASKPHDLFTMKEPATGHYVNARLFGEHPVKLLLDTGAAEVTLSDRSVSGRSLKFTSTSKASMGLRSPEIFRRTAISVALGNNKIDNLPCDVGNMSNSTVAINQLDGVLGANFLARFTVLMDFPAGKIYLRPRESEKARP